MWNYLMSYAVKSTNYSVMNSNNVFNFLISTMEMLKTDDDKKKFLDNMRINIGMSFYDDFKMYLFKKIPSSDLLKFFN
jgi:hypothetical protein